MLTIIIIFIIALYFLSGMYKGLIWNLSVLASSLVSCILAFLLMFPVAALFRNNKAIYNSMLSYTEGAESIYDVELRKVNISELTDEELDVVMNKSNLVFPFRDRVYKNIINERFKDIGISTLGDYFNESMVRVMINIISFLMIYLILRIVLTYIMNWLDYSFKFFVLKKYDWIAGAAIGLIRGILGIAVIFTIMPIVLTVLNFDAVREMVETNALASFFHNKNLILMIIPGI